MHTVGNKPRDHGIYPLMEESFRLKPAMPLANMEPYYTGWDHPMNKPAGEHPVPDSDRNIYFARAMMYGSVLSGGLAGHVHGTAAYDMTAAGEPSGWRPYFYEALKYRSAAFMGYMRDFMLSEGVRYRELVPADGDLQPRESAAAVKDGLEGWSYLMRTPDKGFALVYFELKAARAKIAGMTANGRYRWTWYDPESGTWLKPVMLKTDAKGVLQGPQFPKAGKAKIEKDWAAKILAQ